MARTAKEAGVVLMPGFTAASLITYDRRCYGAVGFTERADWIQLSAGATVVALGGAGRVFQRGFGMTGDGYALLLEAGAQLVNFEFTKFFPLGLPTVRFGPQRPNRRFYDVEGLRVVNGRGEDIFEKHLGQSIQEAMRALYSRFVTMSWVVAKESRDGPVFLDLTRIPRQVWQTLQDVSVQELAMRWGGSPSLWNQLLTKHLLPTRPIPHSFAGGARVGPDMSTGIVGLYAGGEIVDAFSDLSATPMYEVGPLPCALISGHIAGREAGIAASRETRPRQLPSSRYSEDVSWLRSVADNSEGIAPVAVMNEISHVMMANAGPLRNRASMLDGLEKVHQLEATRSQLRAPTVRALSQALGVRSMALVSQAVLRAALMREESRSEHYREDFPLKDDARWTMQIAISLKDDHVLSLEATAPEGGVREA
jgi:succinate dehydrogenase/fumarate reductase flavoprotein subunit